MQAYRNVLCTELVKSSSEELCAAASQLTLSRRRSRKSSRILTASMLTPMYSSDPGRTFGVRRTSRHFRGRLPKRLTVWLKKEQRCIHSHGSLFIEIHQLYRNQGIMNFQEQKDSENRTKLSLGWIPSYLHH